MEKEFDNTINYFIKEITLDTKFKEKFENVLWKLLQSPNSISHENVRKQMPQLSSCLRKIFYFEKNNKPV